MGINEGDKVMNSEVTAAIRAQIQRMDDEVNNLRDLVSRYSGRGSILTRDANVIVHDLTDLENEVELLAKSIMDRSI